MPTETAKPKVAKLGASDQTPAETIKGPASYFPSIEKKYGRPVGEWQQLVQERLPAKHIDLVSMLKAEHGMGHGHANVACPHPVARVQS